MSEATKVSSESHWYPNDVEGQPPHDLLLSLRQLVCDARGRLGPTADPEAVQTELGARGIECATEDVRRVWDPTS